VEVDKSLEGEIRVETDGNIGKITISRPDKLNAMTAKMLQDFDEAVSNLTNNPDISILVFAGEGDKAFCAGFDLKMVQSLEGEEHYNFFKGIEKIISKIRQARTCLTIAAVNGYAVGFGGMIISACDFRLFSKDAAFRLPEIDIDIFPGAGAASNLLHLVGPARAKDILLTGRMVASGECYRIGIADRLYEPDELMDDTMEFARELLKKDQLILLRTKTLVDGMAGETIADAEALEATYLEEWLREHKE